MKYEINFPIYDDRFKIPLLALYFRFTRYYWHEARDMLETRYYWYEIHSSTDWQQQPKCWFMFSFIRGKWIKLCEFQWNDNGTLVRSADKVFFTCKYFIQSFLKIDEKWKVQRFNNTKPNNHRPSMVWTSSI